MTKYFNNHRCRVDFSNDIFNPTKLQILVRHSYLKGFIWFYRWHTIGETYLDIDNEKDLLTFIKRTFKERDRMRKERREKLKMKETKIGYIT